MEDNEFQYLFDILSTKRGAFGQGEREIIDKYIIPLGARCDAFGNYYLRIGTAPVMWSCHTDTVHFQNENGRQRLMLAETYVSLADDENSSCLGADNGAGLWLMLEMIKAGKEGLYVFHRCEERGGKGSKYAANNEASRFEGINFAIAFDRYGTESVITHQCFSRCCSGEFARALKDKLGIAGMRLDDGGVFTDTANYTHIIPECTNLSVGFMWEHTPNETLNLVYLRQLRKSILALNINELPVVRDPSSEEEWSYPRQHVLDDKDFLLANMETVYQVLQDWGCVEVMVDEVSQRL